MHGTHRDSAKSKQTKADPNHRFIGVKPRNTPHQKYPDCPHDKLSDEKMIRIVVKEKHGKNRQRERKNDADSNERDARVKYPLIRLHFFLSRVKFKGRFYLIMTYKDVNRAFINFKFNSKSLRKNQKYTNINYINIKF